MKKILPLILLFYFILLCKPILAQITLGTSPYVQNFDGISTGLPTGFTVRTGATATALGTAATLTAIPGNSTTNWSNTGGGFRNYASANGLISSTPVATQTVANDRALGVRQTGSLGDPGAAFVVQLANTNMRTGFSLSFQLQSVDASSPRTTT